MLVLRTLRHPQELGGAEAAGLLATQQRHLVADAGVRAAEAEPLPVRAQELCVLHVHARGLRDDADRGLPASANHDSSFTRCRHCDHKLNTRVTLVLVCLEYLWYVGVGLSLKILLLNYLMMFVEKKPPWFMLIRHKIFFVNICD